MFLKACLSHIGLDFKPESIRSFSGVSLNGQLGDKTGVRDYQRVAREPLEKWKTTLASPVRRAWCRRYLNWVGDERLKVMGYDREELIAQLNEGAMSWQTVPSDLIRYAWSRIVSQSDSLEPRDRPGDD